LYDELKEVGGHPFFTKGFDPLRWIQEPSSLPEEEYLEIAPVSIVMIQITQLAHFERARINGYSLPFLEKYSNAATGHSQGLISATLASVMQDGNAYYDLLDVYTRYAVYLGLRAQEAYPHPFASDDEKKRSGELGEHFPSPMAALLGSDHDTVRNWLADYNEGKPLKEMAHLSLVNSPDNRILSGDRNALIGFHTKYKDEFRSRKMKYVYLLTSAPFHSPLLADVPDLMKKDLKKIDFTIKGSDLKIPCYSFSDGMDLRQENDMGDRLSREMAVYTLDWQKSMDPVIKDSSITHILDFGPGKTSSRLTGQILESAGRKCDLISASLPRDYKILME
ncbi:MAG: hypothetical protein OEZ34_13805, partial [Spirochaetia bacterium]|nr:hypothetical protein [Spirochaetia bacterium]